MIRGSGAAVVLAASFALAGTATAAPPVLLSASSTQLHPTASFSAPGADDATIYIATSPSQASDGRFLSENLVDLDFLDTNEISAGAWVYERQLNPGRYFMSLRTSASFSLCYDFDTSSYAPSCADGFSQVVAFSIPEPSIKFRLSGKRGNFLGEGRVVELTVRANPLGYEKPYKVCFRQKKRKKCVQDKLSGSSWSGDAEDQMLIKRRGMDRREKFTLYVDNRRVASKTIKTR